MKQALLLILFLGCFKFCVIAQDQESISISDSLKPPLKNNFHVEVGGACFLGSLNYERVLLSIHSTSISLDIGVLPLLFIGKHEPLMGSASIVVLHGKGRHKLLSGAGVGIGKYFNVNQDPLGNNSEYTNILFSIPLGYQFQSKQNYLYRFALNAMIIGTDKYANLLLWPLIGIGKYF